MVDVGFNFGAGDHARKVTNSRQVEKGNLEDLARFMLRPQIGRKLKYRLAHLLVPLRAQPANRRTEFFFDFFSTYRSQLIPHGRLKVIKTPLKSFFSDD